MKYCSRCKCVKPPRSHHCSKCGRCVLRMDHHCRWVDNCVGQRNLKIFLNFTFYLGINCLYTVIVYFYEGIDCLIGRNDPNSDICKGSSAELSLYITLTTGTSILSTLVFAFCCCLLGNQLHLIKQNRSFIDNLQKRKDNHGIELELATKLKNEGLIEF